MEPEVLPSDVRAGLLPSDVDFVMTLRSPPKEYSLSANSFPNLKSSSSAPQLGGRARPGSAMSTQSRNGKVDEAAIRKQQEEAQALRIKQLTKVVSMLTAENADTKAELEALTSKVQKEERQEVDGQINLEHLEDTLAGIMAQIQALNNEKRKRDEVNEQLDATLKDLKSKYDWIIEQSKEDDGPQHQVPSDIKFGTTDAKLLPEIDEARLELEHFDMVTMKSHQEKIRRAKAREM